MYSTSDFRKGLKIELEGKPHEIIEFLHVKPGKGGAFVRTKLKNLITGHVIDRTFRSGEKTEKPDLLESKMQYLYNTEDKYCFMDQETYEQTYLTAEQLGEKKGFLQENIITTILFHNNEPIGIELPIFVEIAISDTEPGLKGDTASGGSKPATIGTGAVIQVPLFLEKGDVIKIDTRTGEYIERVTKRGG
ncbi:MAG: elongation factor P [Thermodesulfobacteriota bacterium]|nr:elongation factor P [Thermodesulfobacteriota bacterium]